MFSKCHSICQYHEAIVSFFSKCKIIFHFSPSTGTGLKIPPAAQQALQMTGSIPFGNITAPAGDGLDDGKHFGWVFYFVEISLTNQFLFQPFQLRLQVKP